jgi:hypothetical protein
VRAVLRYFGVLRRVGWKIFDQKCGASHCFVCETCATGPCAGRSRFRILAGAEGFLFNLTIPGQPWGPPSLLFNGYLLSFPGIKRARE